MTEKKEWSTPELQVLVRHNPEEAILAACKGVAPGGIAAADSQCTSAVCVDCVSISAS